MALLSDFVLPYFLLELVLVAKNGTPLIEHLLLAFYRQMPSLDWKSHAARRLRSWLRRADGTLIQFGRLIVGQLSFARLSAVMNRDSVVNA